MINDQRGLIQPAPNFEVPPSLSTISTEWGKIDIQVVSNDGLAVRLTFRSEQADTEMDQFVNTNFEVFLTDEDIKDIDSFWIWLSTAIQSILADQRKFWVRNRGLAIDLGVEVQNRLRDLIRDVRKITSNEMDTALQEGYLEIFPVPNLGSVRLRWLRDWDEVLSYVCGFEADSLSSENVEFDGTDYYLITKDSEMLRIIIHMALAELVPQNLNAADFQKKFLFLLAQNEIYVATPLYRYAGFKDSFEDVESDSTVSES